MVLHAQVRKTHPALPLILYISGSGGLLERMAACNPDVISLDQSVDLVDGIKRVGTGFAIQVCMLARVAFAIQEQAHSHPDSFSP